jgi:hypothetical protein
MQYRTGKRRTVGRLKEDGGIGSMTLNMPERPNPNSTEGKREDGCNQMRIFRTWVKAVEAKLTDRIQTHDDIQNVEQDSGQRALYVAAVASWPVNVPMRSGFQACLAFMLRHTRDGKALSRILKCRQRFLLSLKHKQRCLRPLPFPPPSTRKFPTTNFNSLTWHKVCCVWLL